MDRWRPRSDEDLVKGIAVQDRAAFGVLYERYSAMIFALARRILGSSSEAEDLVHDVYLEVWRSAHTYEPARGSVRTWLSVRARSRALDRLKLSQHARRTSQDVDDAVEIAVPSQEDPLAQDADTVRRAVAALPRDQRAVLDLFYFDGLSLAEISERLAVPLGTVKSRASRAMARLRSELSDGPR